MAHVATLPASGRQVVIRAPVGADELLALEGAGTAAQTMAALAERLVDGVENWLDLPAVDLGAAALLIRREWIGATIRTDTFCPGSGCGAQIDVAFSVDAYLAHHRPRHFRGVTRPEPGLYEIAGSRFRVPTVGDLLAGTLEDCIDESAPASVKRRIERALEALAPPLAAELGGVCPECGESVELWFEPVDYVLAELHDASTALFQQVHELALAYHWPEAEILGLQRSRRAGYVELVRGELVL